MEEQDQSLVPDFLGGENKKNVEFTRKSKPTTIRILLSVVLKLFDGFA